MKFLYWSEWMIRDVINGGERKLPETYISDWKRICNDGVKKGKESLKNKRPDLYRDIEFYCTTWFSKGLGLGENEVIMPKVEIMTRARTKVRPYFDEIKSEIEKGLKEYDFTFLSLRERRIL